MDKRKQAAVFVCGHTGPLLGVTASFHKAGRPVLFLRAGKPIYSVRKESAIYEISGGPGRHAYVLKKAADHLRDGGFLMIAFDSTYGGAVITDLPFMGRQIKFRRGMATLARLTGVPVIPVSARWIPRTSNFSFSVHSALPVPDANELDSREFDARLTSAAGAWLEQSIREAPDQLQWHFLRRILAYPPAI